MNAGQRPTSSLNKTGNQEKSFYWTDTASILANYCLFVFSQGISWRWFGIRVPRVNLFGLSSYKIPCVACKDTIH